MTRVCGFAISALLAMVVTGASLSDANAQRRPSTLNMTCAQAQALVRSSGAIVLSTGGHTYDRFVVSRQFCTPEEELVATWAPTRDMQQCMVGYRCEMRRSWRFDR